MSELLAAIAIAPKTQREAQIKLKEEEEKK